MRKKLIIVGRGTAGAISAMHMIRWYGAFKHVDIEWHYDPNIKPQAVGEGSTLTLPRTMFSSMDFGPNDLEKIHGTPKYGILKENWSSTGKHTFFHPFGSAEIGYHFNALALQDYVFEYYRDKIKIVEQNVEDPEELDADYVIDCSGTPKEFSKFNIIDTVVVNSVYVTQCFWTRPEFNYTLAIARPYGWVFGIPLTNRCSIGYMYNNTINTLEEIKQDVQYVFEKWNLTPSNTTNNFSFKNYTRKTNFTERVTYTGNNSFFLEPLEATSITTMDYINRTAYDIYTGKISLRQANRNYRTWIDRTKLIIALHYCNGSKFNTNFWDYAKSKTIDYVEECKQTDNELIFQLKMLMDNRHITDVNKFLGYQQPYSTWWIGSLKQNIEGLGIEEIMYNNVNIPEEIKNIDYNYDNIPGLNDVSTSVNQNYN